MKIIDNIVELKAELSHAADQKVGFVPTMGALHAGHIALVERARAECDRVVVSIFVNPTQFNDPKDLERYPRTLESDASLLLAAGVDFVFVPDVKEIYPQRDERVFDLRGIDAPMEGATRPGHFNGVAQVVSRLFDIVEPARSYFGEKDFQQVAVIGQLVQITGHKTEIIVVPTVREESGLALSSRNALLKAEYKASAPAIYQALLAARRSFEDGEASVAEVKQAAREQIELGGLLKVIYLELVDAKSLASIQEWTDSEEIQACVAVQAGEVRLIDNLKIK